MDDIKTIPNQKMNDQKRQNERLDHIINRLGDLKKQVDDQRSGIVSAVGLTLDAKLSGIEKKVDKIIDLNTPWYKR